MEIIGVLLAIVFFVVFCYAVSFLFSEDDSYEPKYNITYEQGKFAVMVMRLFSEPVEDPKVIQEIKRWVYDRKMFDFGKAVIKNLVNSKDYDHSCSRLGNLMKMKYNMPKRIESKNENGTLESKPVYEDREVSSRYASTTKYELIR